ncbi:MAG: peptidylprolyl isomerase [Geminicoccaceae bacterium]|nr:peptidylprolyl isomerase [Geminicoccaceae bacterium]MCX8100553.1 peptidylprolyl isomerase [Geminicoccaceae bacterium]MDW8370857.1 peptidylprolyl isomerase [Geminicoccaceae bacterium]
MRVRGLDRRRLLGGFALSAVLPALAAAQVPAAGTRIVAVVNNEAITSQDLADRVRLALASAGLPDDAETRRRLAPQLLRGLIDEKLQLQEARRLRLEASEAEIDRAFAAIAQRNRLDPPGLAQALRRLGVEPEVFRRQLAAQIAWTKLVERELRPRVAVSREQIEELLGSGEAAEEELLLSEILLPVYAPDQEAQVLAEARDLARSIRQEADFAALARQISAAPSASEGGELGWVRASLLRPEFRNALAGLEKGAVAPPIRTAQGVHLVLLRDRRAAAGVDPARREAEIRRRLEDEQLQRLADRRLRELRRRAFIDIRA